MHKNKKIGIIGVIITIIVLIMLVILTNIDIKNFSSIENVFGKIFMPIQNGIVHLKNKMFSKKIDYEDINVLKEENRKLLEENNKLKEELRDLEIIKAENSTLRAYNNMSQQYKQYNTIPAYIINRDISNLSSTMVINVGSDDGVSSNMPVITSEGLVGYTISVTNKTAKVNPIIDNSSSTSAQISTSKESVVAKGILRKNR